MRCPDAEATEAMKSRMTTPAGRVIPWAGCS